MPIGTIVGAGAAAIIHASAHLVDDQTQSIAVINTPQVIAFNIHHDVPTNLTHSTTVNNSEITFQVTGRYSLAASLEVHNGSGSGELYAWLEDSTDGSTWNAVADSAALITLSANTESVLTLIELYDAQSIGDRIRFRMQGDSTGLDLDHRVASGARPAVPSAVLVIYLVE